MRAEESPLDAIVGRAFLANASFGTLVLVVSSIASVVTHWLVVRAYGPAFHGDLTWLVSIYLGLLTLSDLGITSTVGIRDVARAAARDVSRIGREVGPAGWTTVLAAALCAGSLALFGDAIREGRPSLLPVVIPMASFWLVAHAFLRVCRMVAVGVERQANLLAMGGVLEVGKLASVAVCAAAGLPSSAVFLGFTFAVALAACTSAWRLRALARKMGFSIPLSPLGLAPLRDLLRRGLPYLPAAVSFVGSSLALPILVGIGTTGGDLDARSEVSVTQVCVTLALLPRLVAAPIATSLLPRVASMLETKGATAEAIRVVGMASRFVVLLGTLATIAFHLAGELLLGRVYGAVYAGGERALVILSAAAAFEVYGLQLDQWLAAKGAGRLVMASEIAKQVVLVIVALVLVPAHGSTGVAIAALVAMALAVAGKWVASRALEARISVATPAILLTTVAAIFTFSEVTGLPRWLVIPAWGLIVAMGSFRRR